MWYTVSAAGPGFWLPLLNEPQSNLHCRFQRTRMCSVFCLKITLAQFPKLDFSKKKPQISIQSFALDFCPEMTLPDVPKRIWIFRPKMTLAQFPGFRV